jgi:hypothetical protein
LYPLQAFALSIPLQSFFTKFTSLFSLQCSSISFLSFRFSPFTSYYFLLPSFLLFI